MFRFRKTGFLHSRSRTYCALFLGHFGLKFLPDIRHCVYWVLAEVLATYSSHEIDNKFFIHHCQDWKECSFVCETLWFFSWVTTHPFDLKFVEFCPKFSGDSYVEFREKTISGEFFRNFMQTKAILYRNLWNSALIYAISFRVRIAQKKFTQVLYYVVCTEVMRHVHKQITERRYGEENPGRFVFGKPVLFTLGLGLTAPYSLGILVWNFYQTFVTMSIEFWLRFEPQIRPTRLAINFLFITARVERNVRLCAKLFDFFRGWKLIGLTWNLSRFIPNSVEIHTCNFVKKLFLENFLEILSKPRPLPKLVKFRPYLCNFIPGPYCAEKIHTSTLLCCLHRGNETRP